MAGALDGQVAVVTGAGSGIGRATAVALARAGASVALAGRRREPLDETGELVRAEGGRALVVQADVTDEADAERLIRTATHELGPIDVLVNNAGVNVKRRTLADTSAPDWRRVVEVNLTGPFLVTRAVLPAMRRRGGGTIVNIVSESGRRTYLVAGAAYCAAKYGARSLTDYINLEARQDGVRACAIHPGEVVTPILQDRPDPPGPEAQARMLQPEDVADAVVFVASLPPRAAVEELAIRPTRRRDIDADRATVDS